MHLEELDLVQVSAKLFSQPKAAAGPERSNQRKTFSIKAKEIMRMSALPLIVLLVSATIHFRLLPHSVISLVPNDAFDVQRRPEHGQAHLYPQEGHGWCGYQICPPGQVFARR